MKPAFIRKGKNAGGRGESVLPAGFGAKSR